MTRPFAALALILLLSSACAAPAPGRAPAGPAPTATPGRLSAVEAERCRQQGGSVQRRGRLGWETCVVRYADAGKLCQDKADCQGRCLKPLDDQPARCQADNTRFGCYAEVNGGVAGPALCVD